MPARITIRCQVDLKEFSPQCQCPERLTEQQNLICAARVTPRLALSNEYLKRGMLGACGTLEAAKAFSASHSREDHPHRHTTEQLGHPYRHTTELQTKQQAKYTIESQ